MSPQADKEKQHSRAAALRQVLLNDDSAAPGMFCLCSRGSRASRSLALWELCHSLVADGVLSLFCCFHSCTGCSCTTDSVCNACTKCTAAQHLGWKSHGTYFGMYPRTLYVANVWLWNMRAASKEQSCQELGGPTFCQDAKL